MLSQPLIRLQKALRLTPKPYGAPFYPACGEFHRSL